MTTTEHPAKTPSAKTGLFATLGGQFRAKGIGAPSLRLVGLLALALAALLASAAPASAALTRSLQSSFGPDGTEATHFEFPAALGVDQSNGDTYVADYAAETVRKFDASHQPLAFTATNPDIAAGVLGGFSFTTAEPLGQLAVDSESHDFYVADNGAKALEAFHADGAPALFAAGPGAGTNEITEFEGVHFSELCGVAVDSHGDIYTSDYFNGIHVYAPSGAPLASLPGTGGCNVAVDSQGTLYRNAFEGPVTKFTPSEYPPTTATTYEAKGTVDAIQSWGIAVDPATDNLFVDEHTAVAEYDQAGTRTGAFAEDLLASQGIAADSDSGRVLVSDADPAGERQVEVFAAAVSLPATGEATEIAATTATLNGTIDPSGHQLTDCRFEYISEAVFQANLTALKDGFTGASQHLCEPEAAAIAPDEADHAVQARLTALHNGTTYRFRLVAATAGGEGQGVPKTFETPPAPSIDAAKVTELTATSAKLTAEVDPLGTDTSCHFEWGQTAEPGNPEVPYQHSEPCEPDEDVGSAPGDVPVFLQISGLSANTTYHWRLIATNAAGTTTGAEHTFIDLTEAAAQSCPANEAFRTGPSAGLPDCRAYEMVTPPFKNGAAPGLVVLGMIPSWSTDGSRLTLTSTQCFADAAGCTVKRDTIGSPYAFTRSSAGWVPHALVPPASQFEVSTISNVNPETGSALVSAPTPPQGQDEWYARRPNGSLADIGPVSPPALGPLGPEGNAHLATADLSHLVVQAGAETKWPFLAETTNSSVLEYLGGGSDPIPVGVRGGPGSTDIISLCNTEVGAGNEAAASGSALSVDGRTVFFTASRCPAMAGHPAVPANELYARIDQSETVELSESECGAGPLADEVACRGAEPADAQFEGASADGSKAFFTSTQQLTDDAGEDAHEGDTAKGQQCRVTTGANGCNLYEYDFSRPQGERLIAVSKGDTSGGGPRVQGVVAISSDGSHVYFVARGVLSSAPNGEGDSATDGGENLYVFQRDAAHPGGALSFVATLSEAKGLGSQWADRQLWEIGVAEANISPDGRFLLFVSDAPLTRGDSGAGLGHAQVFRYDAFSGALARLSIGERGFNDNGNAGTGDAKIVGGRSLTFFAGGSGRRNPSMSDDGTRVFFQSPLALTPGALDDVVVVGEIGETEYAQNIYEWEQSGVGSCPAARAAGCVSLISDGLDASAVPNPTCNTGSSVCLTGADARGENVFFSTADQLVPTDTDTGVDYYDARVGGGFAEAANVMPCQTSEACHLGNTASAAPQTHGSAAFNAPPEGPNHPQKPKCKKGQVGKHGRCVKKGSKKHHGKKHHGKKAQKRTGSRHGGQK